MKLSQVSIDPGKAVDGEWFDVSERAEVFDFRIRIASMGNPRFRAACRPLLKPHTKRLRDKGLSDDEFFEIVAPAAAEFVVTDIEGLENDDGTPLAYSVELGLRLLTEPHFRHIRDFITDKAGDIEKFLSDVQEESSGNSRSGSNGNSK
ncbi:MAG: hypothetical protein VW405_01985 [Rhodospirillaceae bacterium]